MNATTFTVSSLLLLALIEKVTEQDINLVFYAVGILLASIVFKLLTNKWI